MVKENKEQDQIYTSYSSHLSLLIHQTQTQDYLCSKEMLVEYNRAKLARRNAESVADLWHTPTHCNAESIIVLFP